MDERTWGWDRNPYWSYVWWMRLLSLNYYWAYMIIIRCNCEGKYDKNVYGCTKNCSLEYGQCKDTICSNAGTSTETTPLMNRSESQNNWRGSVHNLFILFVCLLCIGYFFYLRCYGLIMSMYMFMYILILSIRIH